MTNERTRVCPAELAGSLDNKVRWWVQNPHKILGPFVKEGMTVLDVGCGPGFFSREAAQMVGPTGRVISADLQEQMLEKLRAHVRGTPLESRITLVHCTPDSINVSGPVDFILAFYMVHEVPRKDLLFKQLLSVLAPSGQMLLVEPKLAHVSKKDFQATLATAEAQGFTAKPGPKLILSWSAILSLTMS